MIVPVRAPDPSNTVWLVSTARLSACTYTARNALYVGSLLAVGLLCKGASRGFSGAKRLFALGRARNRESHVVAEAIEHRHSGRLHHSIRLPVTLELYGEEWGDSIGWSRAMQR